MVRAHTQTIKCVYWTFRRDENIGQQTKRYTERQIYECKRTSFVNKPKINRVIKQPYRQTNR